MVSGRPFTQSDGHASAPVVIVNQQFVRTYFKGENPIGQHIRIGAMMGPGFEDPVREIVGVLAISSKLASTSPHRGPCICRRPSFRTRRPDV